MSRAIIIAGVAAVALAAAGVTTVGVRYPDLSARALARAAMLVNPPARPQALLDAVRAYPDAGGVALTFALADARRWDVAGESTYHVETDDALPGLVFARVASAKARPGASAALGLRAFLTPDFAQRANGRRVEFGVIARSPSTHGAGALAIVYATQQAGNSGWRTFRLSRSFAAYTAVFEVPRVAEGYAKPPFISIHADALGRGREADVLAVFARILPEGGSEGGRGLVH